VAGIGAEQAPAEVARERAGRGVKELLRRHPLAAYFTLAIAGTWALIVPLLLGRVGEYGLGLLPYTAPEPLFLALFLLSPFAGPTLAAYVVTGATEGKAGVKRLLRRYVQWRVGPQWYAAAMFTFLALWVIGLSVAPGAAPALALAQNWPLLFTLFLPNVLFGILFPSLGEEPGWRGFALPRLQAAYGPVAGSLILGSLHGFWHLPGYFNGWLGAWHLPTFVAFVLTAIGVTFVYTWIVNHARGSLLLAMLVHASINASSALLGKVLSSDTLEAGFWRTFVEQGWLNAAIFLAGALALVVVTRGRLGYRAEPA
jgi:membrane protease YdiL (CAAX protease family)